MQDMINVRALIGSPSALTREQGELVYNSIVTRISQKKHTVLDFAEIESLITPFLNVAIGKLYADYTSDELNRYLSIINIPASKTATIQIVIANAKRFYKDGEAFNRIVKGEMD